MMASSISPMEFCELVKVSGSSEIVGICVTKPTNVICEVKRILWKLKTNGVKGVLNCTSKIIKELDCLVQGFIVQLELKFSRSHTCLMSAFNFPNNLSFFIYVIGKPKTSEIFSEFQNLMSLKAQVGWTFSYKCIMKTCFMITSLCVGLFFIKDVCIIYVLCVVFWRKCFLLGGEYVRTV